MEAHQQTILRMELQIGQLIRMVANLNERVDILERKASNRTTQRAMHIKGMSGV
ncbi:hypothetical protein [Sporosarcina sp. A2]|uniref:hypothetical protein n=1 Tax=Sporosarcina sp. A2 TaxID=3393449 RepID=UPI003D793765